MKLLGSYLVPMETLDMAALESIMPWLIGFGAYVLVLIGLAITGLVLQRIATGPSN